MKKLIIIILVFSLGLLALVFLLKDEKLSEEPPLVEKPVERNADSTDKLKNEEQVAILDTAEIDVVESLKDETVEQIEIVEEALTTDSQINIGDVLGMKSFEWVKKSSLQNNLIEGIKTRMRPAFSSQPDRKEIVTRASVLPYVGRSLSMAFPPVKGIEIDGYYLLSGGTTSDVVNDFSSGIAVDSNSGEIYLWNKK